MARQKVMLQRPKQITGAETQENDDALLVGSNRRGVVFCDVHAISGLAFTVTISTCSDRDATVSALASWVSLGAMVFSSTGSQKLAVTGLGCAMRWEADVQQTMGSGTATFALRTFLSDE